MEPAKNIHAAALARKAHEARSPEERSERSAKAGRARMKKLTKAERQQLASDAGKASARARAKRQGDS